MKKKNANQRIVYLSPLIKDANDLILNKMYARINDDTYIICYAKNIELVEIKGTPITNADRYKGKDEYYQERGPYYLQK